MSQSVPSLFPSQSPIHRPISRLPSRMPTRWRTEISTQLQNESKKRRCGNFSVLVLSIMTFLTVACLATFSWLSFFGGVATTLVGAPKVVEALNNETETFITSLHLLQNQFEACNSSECLPLPTTYNALFDMTSTSHLAPTLAQYYYTMIAALARMPEFWNVTETEHAYAHLNNDTVTFFELALEYPIENVTRYALQLLYSKLESMPLECIKKPFDQCTPHEQENIERLRTAVELAVNRYPSDNVIYVSYCCLILPLQIKNPPKQRLVNLAAQAENLDVMTKSLVLLGLQDSMF